MPKCMVESCSELTENFSLPEDSKIRRIVWLERSGHADLVDSDDETVPSSFRICPLHFHPKCWLRASKLNWWAVPSLHLPAYSPSGSIEDICYMTEGEAAALSATERSTFANVICKYLLVKKNMRTPELQTFEHQPTATIKEESISSQNDNFQELDRSENQMEITSNINWQNIITADECHENQSLNQAEIDELQIDTGTFEVDNQGNLNPTSSPIEKPFFKSIKCYFLDCNKFNEVCRVCFRSLIKEDEVVKLYGEETSIDDQTRIKNMLKLVLPDMDLDFFLNITICTKCTKLLEYSYQLKQTWLAAEAKLQRILEKNGVATNQDADLVIAKKELKHTMLSEIDSDSPRISINQKQQTDEEPEMTDRLLSSIDSYSSEEDFFYSKRKKSLSDLIATKLYYLCEICGKMCFSSRSFKIHCRIHHTEQKNTECSKPKCSICGKEFEYRRHLRSHIYRTHTFGTFQCHLCGKRLANQRTLIFHLHSHNTNKKMYTCNICDKKLSNTDSMRRHLRTHITDSWTCTYCGKCLKYEKSLQKHIQLVHMKQGEFVCEYCSKPFWHKKDLLKHRIRVHGWFHEVQKVQEDPQLENEAHLCSSLENSTTECNMIMQLIK